MALAGKDYSDAPPIYMTGEQLWAELRKLDCSLQDSDAKKLADKCSCMKEIPLGPLVCVNGQLYRSVCEATCADIISHTLSVCSNEPWPPCNCTASSDGVSNNFPLRVTEVCSKHCIPDTDFIELENTGKYSNTTGENSHISI